VSRFHSGQVAMSAQRAKNAAGAAVEEVDAEARVVVMAILCALTI
jgi:hypothetical protein